ncbi:MAG: FHA domain-containing protein, partial [Planctomycetes bacterium]|nr:FHA domain-containing protein [Planctomycetota bacterium]
TTMIRDNASHSLGPIMSCAGLDNQHVQRAPVAGTRLARVDTGEDNESSEPRRGMHVRVCRQVLEDALRFSFFSFEVPDRRSRMVMSDHRVEIEVVVRPSDNAVDQLETLGYFWLAAGKAVVIGRSARDADVPLGDDPSLSKRHFSVAFDGQRCRLVDLASKNGTLVNGSRVSSIDLHHGDVVWAGQTVFRVSVVSTSAEPPDDDEKEDTALSSTSSIAADPQDEPAVGETSSTDGGQAEQEQEQDGLFLTLIVAQTPTVSSDDLRASRTIAWIRAGQTVVVGRTAWESDWAFRGDDQMSSKHFSVTCDGRRCFVSDLGSANGTIVNRIPIAHVELNHGDRILAGRTEFAAQIVGRE